jgi:hypothetical protein
MAIKEKQSSRRPEIDLSGPGGNAFSLLGNARTLAKQLNLDYSKIQAEMTASDYENLINVFDSYFGEYVDLIRP